LRCHAACFPVGNDSCLQSRHQLRRGLLRAKRCKPVRQTKQANHHGRTGDDKRDRALVPPASGKAVGFIVDPFGEIVAESKKLGGDDDQQFELPLSLRAIVSRGSLEMSSASSKKQAEEDAVQEPVDSGKTKKKGAAKGKEKPAKGKAGSDQAASGDGDSMQFPSAWQGCGASPIQPSDVQALSLLSR